MSELPTGRDGDVFSVKEQRWVAPESMSEAGQSAAVVAARDALFAAIREHAAHFGSDEMRPVGKVPLFENDPEAACFIKVICRTDALCAAAAREAIAQLPCYRKWDDIGAAQADRAVPTCLDYPAEIAPRCPTCEARAT